MTSSFSSTTMAGIAAQLGASKPVPVSFGWGWLGKGQGFVALAPDGFRLSGTVGGKPVEASVPRTAVQAATWKRQRVLMKIDRGAGPGHKLTWIDAEPKIAERIFAWLPDAVTHDPSIIGRWYEDQLGPYRSRAWMSWLIALLLVGVFIWQGINAGSWASIPVPKLISQGGNLAPLTLDGEPWRLLMAVLLHGGLDHLVGNLIAFLVIAPYLERLYGRAGLLGLFLATGVIGSLIDLWLNFRVVCVGASGAIFGLFGALLAYALRRRGELPLKSIYTILVCASLYMIWQIKAGFDSVGTNNAVHVTGALSGIVLGLLVAPPLRAPWREARQVFAGLVLLGLAVGLAAAALPYARTGDDWKFSVLIDGIDARYDQARQACLRQLEAAEQANRPVAEDFTRSCLEPISALAGEVRALQPRDVDLLERQASIDARLKARRQMFAQSGLRLGSVAELVEIEAAQQRTMGQCQAAIEQLGSASAAAVLDQLQRTCQRPLDTLHQRLQGLRVEDGQLDQVSTQLRALVASKRDSMDAIATAIAADDIEAFNRAVQAIEEANARYRSR